MSSRTGYLTPGCFIPWWGEGFPNLAFEVQEEREKNISKK